MSSRKRKAKGGWEKLNDKKSKSVDNDSSKHKKLNPHCSRTTRSSSHVVQDDQSTESFSKTVDQVDLHHHNEGKTAEGLSHEELLKKQKSAAVEPEPPSPPSESLSAEQLERIARNKRAAVERLASANVPPGFGESWRKELSAEFSKPYFKQLMSFVSEERKRHTVYPPVEHVFTWTQMCGSRDVKVVILGQDPYHGPDQAHGLCFSVKRPVHSPPSLENMYKELTSDIEGFQHPGHGDLTGWAKQGVLLLNAVLTVRAHQANSHKDKGWEVFTDAVVQWLSNNQEGIVFMLWGSYAQKKGAAINRKRHHVLQAVHPSPLSAHRGFFGCRHFSKANELLKKSGKSPIDWKAL